MTADGLAARPGYLDHWGLAEAPFLLEPDPRFAYERADHQEGLARVLFGISQLGGLTLVTGEIGSGKTLLCQALARLLDGEGFRVAMVANPPRTPAALLAALLAAAGGEPAGGSAARLARLLRARLAAIADGGGQVVLVIDEAQRLDTRALDEVRMLTNPGDAGPGAPVALLGQPELARQVERMPQVAQRVVVRYHLGPMSAEEVAAYADHRARVAGARRPVLSPRAAAAVHAETGGVPRLVNMLLANALFVAASRGEERVDEDTIRDLAEDRRMSERAARADDEGGARP